MARLNSIIPAANRPSEHVARAVVSRTLGADAGPPASGDRFERILSRRRRRVLHRGGFAPDLVHGERELGDAYDVFGADALEGTVLVTTLKLDQGARLFTLGRWSEGFLDILQWFESAESVTPFEVMDAVLTMMEGADSLLGATGADVRALLSLLAELGEDDAAARFATATQVPVALNRDDLLVRETAVLSLVREDVASAKEVREIFAGAGQEPMAKIRLLDAGRADLLTTHALSMARALVF